jgi:hypothetical protein
MSKVWGYDLDRVCRFGVRRAAIPRGPRCVLPCRGALHMVERTAKGYFAPRHLFVGVLPSLCVLGELDHGGSEIDGGFLGNVVSYAR